MKHIFPLLLLALMVVGTPAVAQESDQRASFQSYKQLDRSTLWFLLW